MSFSSSQARAEFFDNHGIHQFALHDGTTVTGVSAPTWEEFERSLVALDKNPALIGEIVMSPELITIAPFSEPDQPEKIWGVNIERREQTACDFSTDNPHTTLILGTQQRKPDHDKPTNMLVYIKAGEVVGHTEKMPYYPAARSDYPYEQAVSATASQPLPDYPHILPLISSDVLFHRLPTNQKRISLAEDAVSGNYRDPITDQITSLLISAQWQVPLADDLNYVRTRAEYLAPLDRAVQTLFRRYSTLNDIIVVDRVPEMPDLQSHPTEPLNAHYRRIED